jgi:hypothetical protein
MEVGMKPQGLTPGVQHRQHADACAETAWVGSDLQQGLGSGPKQQSIEEVLVA